MPSSYNKTGAMHHVSIADETSTAALFNVSPPSNIAEAYPGKKLTFKKAGGTKQVEDIHMFADGEQVPGVSLKSRSSESGTLDHMNLSRDLTTILPWTAEIVTRAEGLASAHRGDATAKESVRDSLKKLTNEQFLKATDTELRQVLVTANARLPAWIVVIEKKKREMSVFRHEELEELARYPYDPAWVYFLRSPRGSMDSRQIWRKNGAVEVNTRIRIRVLTNNGVGALLGIGGKSACICLKLQQEGINGLLAAVQRVRIALA